MTTISWKVARTAGALVILANVLAGCASSTDGFTPEGQEDDPIDTNLMKGVMQGLGAIDPNEKAIDYKPRAPLVVPPNRNLPPPRDAASADPRFPRNPEEVADEQRRAAAKGDKGRDGHIMTPEELAKYAMPGAGRIERYDPDPGRRLSPDQLRGQGMSNDEAVKRAANPTGRKTLIEPPDQYRKPSPNAPVAAPEEKSSWKPGWWPL